MIQLKRNFDGLNFYMDIRNAEFILQPKGDMNIALQNLRECDSF